MRVVFDANVAAAGLVFRGEAWACLVKLARRQAFAFGIEILRPSAFLRRFTA